MPRGAGTYGKKKGRPKKGKANVKKINAQLKANQKLKESKGQLGNKLYEYQTGYGAVQGSHGKSQYRGSVTGDFSQPTIVNVSDAARRDIVQDNKVRGNIGYGYGTLDPKERAKRKSATRSKGLKFKGSRRGGGNIEAGMN